MLMVVCGEQDHEGGKDFLIKSIIIVYCRLASCLCKKDAQRGKRDANCNNVPVDWMEI